MMWKLSIKAIGDLLLQRACPLCDRPTPQVLCHPCWQQLQRQAAPPPIPPTSALPVLSWGIYQGPLKHAIAALKYQSHPELAVPLGQALGKRWQQSPLSTRQPPIVVPIPMHRDKQQARGFNQAELLAQAFCTQTGLKLVKQGLQRHRATAPQFGLGPAERQQNLTGAFVVGKTLRERPHLPPVLLLDDIYTTGTTAMIAAQTLRRHRISVCGIAAIAQAVMDEAA